MDAGHSSHSDELMAALRAHLTGDPHHGHLTDVVITHGHPDHIGALEQLLILRDGSGPDQAGRDPAFANLTIYLHELERPFMCDGVLYGTCPSDGCQFRLFHAITTEDPRTRVCRGACGRSVKPEPN